MPKLGCFDSEIRWKFQKGFDLIRYKINVEFHVDCGRSQTAAKADRIFLNSWERVHQPATRGDETQSHCFCLACWHASFMYLLLSPRAAHRSLIRCLQPQLYNKTIKCALHWSLTLTLFTQETLPAIGTEAHGLQRRLRDARCPVTAGVELAGTELAPPACVEWGALTKPVLRIAKRGDTEGGGISPGVKRGQWICSDVSTARDVMIQQPTQESLKAMKKM